MSLLLSDVMQTLAVCTDAELTGNPSTVINRLSPLESAGPEDLAFLSNPRYAEQLLNSKAACVIVSTAMAHQALQRGSCIIASDPYHCFALVTQLWKKRHPLPLALMAGRIHPSAFIDPTAKVALTAWVGAFVCIEAGAVIEKGVHIGSHCSIGQNAHVGQNTRLAPHVSVMHECQIGERCIVHSGVVIGADGFGFAPHVDQWTKIEQLGTVIIGNDVEIGANTCIDRGALDNTVIGDGVKIDNLVQIGHNVRIGKHSAMAGCVGIAGSAVIGAHCTLGGGAIVLGHLQLADHVHVSAATVVTRSIGQAGQYTGLYPTSSHADWEKNAATLRNLHALRERLRKLEKLPNMQ